ncbi:MAG: hypothetical protein IJZ38_09370, partial [Bacteroides sp.]|nr:hypothetical protein [Bacteroides sp.]
NKVAVPEGAAGTPPFWRPETKDVKLTENTCQYYVFFKKKYIDDEGKRLKSQRRRIDSPIAQ